MNGRLILRLAIALTAFALPAAAQDRQTTRAGDAYDARRAKAEQLAPYRPGTVERVITFIESDRLRRLLAPHAGFGVRFGGIENGPGFALGPSFRASNLFDGRVQLHGSGAASVAGDREIEAGVALPHAAPRVSIALEATSTRLAGERFSGLGMDSIADHTTAFALETTRVSARATIQAASWLQISAVAGGLGAAAGDGSVRHVPAIGTRFTADQAPGISRPASWRVVAASATVDGRDVPGNPRSGGRYHVGVARHADGRQRHSFTRVDVEMEQHVSGWKRQRVLTLRAVASASVADRGQNVPFYLQPTLGGSRLLRGFVTDRFRGAALLGLQAEYGWDLSPFLGAVLFYETGATASRWHELQSSGFRRDYGIGFRFGSARTVMFRTDVVLGSGEGARIAMRFNHAF